jgi:hypothetical protein
MVGFPWVYLTVKSAINDFNWVKFHSPLVIIIIKNIFLRRPDFIYDVV